MIFEYSGKYIESGDSIKGKLESESKGEALFELKELGIIPLEFKEVNTLNRDIRFRKRLKNADFVMFLRQYATLINAGISISETTKTLAIQVENERLREALEDIDTQVERGESLSTATRRHGKIFPELLVNMIYAGETSGRLDEILINMADYYEKQHKNQRKMISSLLYPGAISVVAVALTVFLLVFIIPTFTEMFASLGENLPAYTVFVMALSDNLQQYWYFIVIGIVLAVLGFRLLLKNERFAYRIDALKLKIPILGALVHKLTIVRMTHTLSVLLNASIPILQSLEITEKVVTNRVVKESLFEMRDILTNGGEMSSVMVGKWVFPPLLTQMVQVGEKTGSLDSMLHKVKDYYEEEANQLSDRFGSMIEPVLIVTLAFVVGAIIMAIIVPMFSMYENFS